MQIWDQRQEDKRPKILFLNALMWVIQITHNCCARVSPPSLEGMLCKGVPSQLGRHVVQGSPLPPWKACCARESPPTLDGMLACFVMLFLSCDIFRLLCSMLMFSPLTPSHMASLCFNLVQVPFWAKDWFYYWKTICTLNY